MTRPALRRELVARRRQLGPGQARRAGLHASQRAWQLQLLGRARRIAAYLPMGGELDCRPLIRQAWLRGREIYLPVLHGQRLRFRAYSPDTRMTLNRFGIPEPAYGQELPPTAMDVAITPLVGFDLDGNRLGMGGGFYDRSFHFLRHRARWRHPRLVGFAYDMQCLPALDSFPWDVPLDAVVTESTIYIFAV